MGLSSKVSSFSDTKVDVHENHKGIHWLMAVVFVLGDMVGGGMIVLPSAMSNTGLIPGITLLIVCGLITAYTAYQLSENWIMMQQRWPKYRNDCRKPYTAMALRACGPNMRTFLSFMLCLAQFGFAVVLLLLAAKNAAILLNFFFSVRISFCYLIVIAGLIVWPATMLKSPMHFWQVAVFSAASSSIAVILIVSGVIHDSSECTKNVGYTAFEPQKFFMTFGTLVFAYGGHNAFPTIQHDMKKPALFNRTIYLSFSEINICFATYHKLTFAVIVLYYAIISISGYMVYGASIGDTIITSIQLPWVQQTVNTMIAIHVMTTIVIIISPLTQLCEDLFKIPHTFGWQRFLIRTGLFWSVIFAALSLPNFGPVMDLIGASTMTGTSIIFPCIFYLYLNASQKKREERIIRGEISAESPDDETATWRDVIYYTKRPVLLFNVFCIFFGIFGGVTGTIASIMKMTSEEVAAPCYVQYFREGLPFNDANAGLMNCCGLYRNTTVSGVSPVGYCTAI